MIPWSCRGGVVLLVVEYESLVFLRSLLGLGSVFRNSTKQTEQNSLSRILWECVDRSGFFLCCTGNSDKNNSLAMRYYKNCSV